jgi:hypothetical protein
MKNDSIVDEVRNNGLALAARCNNNLEAICKALKERERSSGRLVVDRAPRRVPIPSSGHRAPGTPSSGDGLPNSA